MWDGRHRTTPPSTAGVPVKARMCAKSSLVVIWPASSRQSPVIPGRFDCLEQGRRRAHAVPTDAETVPVGRRGAHPGVQTLINQRMLRQEQHVLGQQRITGAIHRHMTTAFPRRPKNLTRPASGAQRPGRVSNPGVRRPGHRGEAGFARWTGERCRCRRIACFGDRASAPADHPPQPRPGCRAVHRYVLEVFPNDRVDRASARPPGRRSGGRKMTLSN